MSEHTIHETLPSGFTYADAMQQAEFERTGSVNGASKVALVASDDPLPYPNLAVRLRPPRKLSDVKSDLGRNAVDSVEQYIRDYNAGYTASGRSGESARWEAGNTPHSWDDGYLDRAAGRAKWHLTYCSDHNECGEG